VDPTIVIRHTDMDVDAKDQQRAGDHLQLIYEQLVSSSVIDLLL
jgi:hypothetical protein